MNTISTIIPVYQDSGLPFEILKEAVNSIMLQSHPPIEIILSDDSTGNAVERWVDEFNAASNLNVIYRRNSGSKGVSSNTNFATTYSRGTLIHFLHSDDRLIGRDVYSNVINAFDNFDSPWLLLSGQMKGVVTVPSLENLNLFGVNTVGGPSGVVIKRSIFELFDENISLLMDIDFFLRVLKKHGSPIVSDIVSIEYGSGNWQLTKSIDQEKYFLEIDYLWKKGRLGYKEFSSLLEVKDSWNIKRDAYAYVSSSAEVGKVKKLQAAIHFKFVVSKFRIQLLIVGIVNRIYLQK